MGSNKNAKKMEADQEPHAEHEEPLRGVAEGTSGEGRPEPSEEANQLDENSNASEVRVTDKRRFSAEGEPVADSEESKAAEQAGKGSEEVEQLRARLNEAESKRLEAERQVRDYAERFRHAQVQIRADNDELRARLQRNFEQKLEASRGDLVASLLDVLDNLKRAVAAAESSGKQGPAFESLLNGVRATAEMFEARMSNLGLAQVSSEGEEFNPEIHEAVETVSVAPDQDNRVVAELQPGYKFGERLLRPARVRVGRASD